MSTKIPNYHMLRQMCIQSKLIKHKYPELDQMPNGAICPGYDIELLPALGVLQYIYGITTQWSCQGNHKDGVRSAYILLAPDNIFPEDLIDQIYLNGLILLEVADYSNGEVNPKKTRWKLCSNWDRDEHSTESLQQLNSVFINVLNQWAESEIKTHIPNIKPQFYFKDFIQMYA